MSSEDTKTIVLDKGQKGLGFHIRGGYDNQHIPGDTGIFVTRLKEGAAAHTDGRLKEGDRILEIDGISVRNVTHNEAVSLFLRTGPSCQLLVEPDAERKALTKAAASLQSNSLITSSRNSDSTLFTASNVIVFTAGALTLSLITLYLARKKGWSLFKR
ncbi:synaptojanin-2-binding protein-like [Convolutriloba macropyga]|uniref:synaptojanin-2-binding protein-like n=1 Tax=Convolutriloba macropyga TaxID=536237 RepID=UPI003F51D779